MAGSRACLPQCPGAGVPDQSQRLHEPDRLGQGATAGGLFLREFVDGIAWAHLDIAAVAYADKPSPYVPRGAVGWGVRSLVGLVERAARK